MAGGKLRLLLLLVAIFCLTPACSVAQEREAASPQQPPSTKILIAYLSRTGNTSAVAQLIRQRLGGDVVAIETETAYPTDYNEILRQVAAENESGYLPPLRTKIDRIKEYDVIFIGFPTWGMRLPPPIKRFLRQYDLKGKTVVPFNTNAGYGAGSSFQTMKELASDAIVLPGLSIRGGAERDGQYLVIKGQREKEVEKEVTEWLRQIKMLK